MTSLVPADRVFFTPEKAGPVMVHWVSQSLHRAITGISSMRSSAPEREGYSLAMISKQKRRLEGLRVNPSTFNP